MGNSFIRSKTLRIFFVDLFEDLWWEYYNVSDRFTVGL